jgi:hypothetical protein
MRSSRVILTALLIALALFNPALAEKETGEKKRQEKEKIGVVKAAICKEVIDLCPVSENEVFPCDVKKLYCFTRVTGANRGEIIKHIWYYQGTRLAVIILPIKSPDYRTYSSKKIEDYQKGEWRVEVMSLDGINLATLNFTIE